MTQENWDKLLPNGMQWVSGRNIKAGDIIVDDWGSQYSAYGCYIDSENTWGLVRACCPIVSASAPFDGGVDLLAREQERKVNQVEAIIDKPIAPLTNHAKYCRLSKQAGGLCGRIISMGTECRYDDSIVYSRAYIHSCDTQCARPEKQQPVELPKPDPLEELINATAKKSMITPSYLREFAEKVKAL